MIYPSFIFRSIPNRKFCLLSNKILVNFTVSNFTTMSYFFGSSAPVEEIPLIPVSTKPICTNVFNSEKTNEAVSADFVVKIEQKIEELKGHLTSNPSEWENFFTEKGVNGVRKFVEGKDLAIIRSETVMPFHIVDSLNFLDNSTNAPLMDFLVNQIKVLKRSSVHTWVSCTTLHGVRKIIFCSVI